MVNKNTGAPTNGCLALMCTRKMTNDTVAATPSGLRSRSLDAGGEKAVSFDAHSFLTNNWN